MQPVHHTLLEYICKYIDTILLFLVIVCTSCFHNVFFCFQHSDAKAKILRKQIDGRGECRSFKCYVTEEGFPYIDLMTPRTTSEHAYHGATSEQRSAQVNRGVPYLKHLHQSPKLPKTPDCTSTENDFQHINEVSNEDLLRSVFSWELPYTLDACGVLNVQIYLAWETSDLTVEPDMEGGKSWTTRKNPKVRHMIQQCFATVKLRTILKAVS